MFFRLQSTLKMDPMAEVKQLQEFRVSLIYMEYDARKMGLTVTPALLAAARTEIEDILSNEHGVRVITPEVPSVLDS